MQASSVAKDIAPDRSVHQLGQSAGGTSPLRLTSEMAPSFLKFGALSTEGTNWLQRKSAAALDVRASPPARKLPLLGAAGALAPAAAAHAPPARRCAAPAAWPPVLSPPEAQ